MFLQLFARPYLIFLILFSYAGLSAQSAAWGTSTGTDLQVLYNSNTVTYEFTNGNTALSNASFEIQLGTGIEYLSGNLVYTTSGSAVVTEGSVTGANLVIFNIGSLAINEVVSITFPRQASCAARAHKIASGTFNDVAHIYEGGTELTYLNNGGSAYELIYDVIYGNIVLSAPTHSPSSSTSVGGTVTRAVNITNGNFGSIDEFWFQDDYEEGNVSLSNFAINGTTIAAGNITDDGDIITIKFDNTNIINIDGSAGTNGDADAVFEKDEYFTLTYDVKLLQCASGTLLSDIDAFYGIDENTPCNPSGSNSTSISVTNGTPEIAMTGVSNPKIDLCGSTTHVTKISNNATDPEDFAKDVVIFIGLRSNNSAIATVGNVTMWSTAYHGVKNFSNFTINGFPITTDSITGVHSNDINYIPYNYYMSDPDAPGSGLEDLDGDGYYDDLAAGQSIDIGFDMTLTPKQGACGTGRKDYIHWEHISVDANWSNQCGAEQAPKRKEINYSNIIRNYNQSTFIEGPSDINDGDKFEVKINPHFYSGVNCNGGNGLTGNDVTWTVKCILPAGITLQTSATTDAHHSGYSPSIWQSNDTVFYEINRYNRDWFTFPLELDCTNWDNTKPMPFDFVTTYKCGSCWEEDIHCETFLSVPHCPGPCTGVVTTDFYAQRTTAGWTDNTQASQVTLTEGTHGLDKLLPLDTIRMTVDGYISDTISDNLHLRITYTPDIGDDIFDYVDGNITLFDLDGTYGNTEYNFPITTPPTVTSTANTGNDTYYWDFDLTSYIGDIDPAYVLGEGIEADSFIVVLNAIYNKNPGYSYYKVNTFRANFFMLGTASEEISCDSYGTPMFYTGFGGNVGGNAVNLNGCGEDEMYGYFTWYNLSGDLFPNEYRPIQRIDSIVMKIPDGIKFLGATSSGSISGSTAHYINGDGDVVVYPTGTYKPLDWTQTHSPRMDVHIKATCELASGGYQGEIHTYRTLYNYHPDVSLHQQEHTSDLNEPTISYVQPNVAAVPLNQVQNGIVDSVEWDIQACNSTAGLDVDYNWVILDNSASTGISVIRVLDSGGTPIATTDFGGGQLFVPLGSLDGGDCTTFKVIANYSSCDPDDLVVDFGWDCDAYPASSADLLDCGSPTFVRVIPLEAGIASAITPLATTPDDPANPSAGTYGSTDITTCEEFPVEYRIISSSNATMYDINFDVLIPNSGTGLTYVPNSATIEVEGVDVVNSPRAIDAAGEAVLVAGNSGLFNVKLSDLDATNFGSGQGLMGAGNDPTMNEVIIRFKMQSTCNFTSGKRLKVKTFGESACGDVASGNGETVNSSSLTIDGIVIPYAVSFVSAVSPNSTFTGCSDIKVLSADMNIIGGPTGSSDSLFVTLPTGVTYNGSFNCTSTNCPTFSGTRIENGNEIVLFKYPSGISNELLSIDFEVTTDANNVCGDVDFELSVQAEIAGLYCSATNSTCPSATVETGFNAGTLTLENSELEITFNSLVLTQGVPNQYNYDITVTNNSAIPTDQPISVDFYEYDVVNDSITGIIRGTVTATAIIPGNGSEQITGFFSTIDELTDGVVAVIDRSQNENCSCPHSLGMDDNPTATSAAALPVELVYFEGKAEDCTIDLSWTTLSESNSSHFILEYSDNGREFSMLDIIEAFGNTNERKNYNYSHKGILENTNYYRLTQFDFDGRSTKSPTISINTDCKVENFFSVFPNPVDKNNANLTVKFFAETKNSTIEVYDLLGGIAKSMQVESRLGRNTTKIDISNLPAGTYFIKEQSGKNAERIILLE